MLCLVIDFKMRKFSGIFLSIWGAQEKTQKHFIRSISESAVLCSQKFWGLPEMVKNPFWYKKYKLINCLKASDNCSMWVVHWQSLNRFSGGLLNILLMLGLHHRCLPENFRKIFQNTRQLLQTLNICKVLISKEGKLI